MDLLETTPHLIETLKQPLDDELDEEAAAISGERDAPDALGGGGLTE